MSVSYHNLVRQVAYNVGALRGARTQEIATSYAAPITAVELNDTAPPLQVLFDVVLRAEQEFANVIATTGNHPWRTSLRAFTANLADKALLPAVDSAGKDIIGVYGPVRDATDNTPLVEMPLAVVARRVRNANNHYLISVYYYKIDGSIIRHTRTNVTVEVCSYDRTVQAIAVAADGVMVLPDTLEAALVDRATCLLNPKHNPEYANAMIGAIKAGLTSVPSRSAPLPITLEKAG